MRTVPIGRAQTHGAISIVNALTGGIGAAVGIDLPVHAEVRLDPRGPADEFHPPESNTPILRAALDLARGAQGRPDRATRFRIEVRSEVPAGCGLKSSSAVGLAAYFAAERALGREPKLEEAARTLAAAARAAGQSATGAFDDNLAAGGAGIWVTDNRSDTILRHDPVPDDLVVVLWIPPGSHPSSPTLKGLWETAGPAEAIALVLAGRPWEALEANARLVEERLGLPPTDQRGLRGRGARASGVSGLGPARAIVVPGSRSDSVLGLLRDAPGTLRVVPFAQDLPGGSAP